MYSTYLRLGLHVSDSDIAVIRAVRKRIAPKYRRDRLQSEERKTIYRIMLRHHREARDLYVDVMRGDLTPETI